MIKRMIFCFGLIIFTSARGKSQEVEILGISETVFELSLVRQNVYLEKESILGARGINPIISVEEVNLDSICIKVLLFSSPDHILLSNASVFELEENSSTSTKIEWPVPSFRIANKLGSASGGELKFKVKRKDIILLMFQDEGECLPLCGLKCLFSFDK